MSSFNKSYDDIKPKTDSIERIKEIVATCCRFKIGKTGQSLPDRFDIEYKDLYDRIELVYSSSSKVEIDNLEKWLIGYFQELKLYASKCDNEAVGGGEMEDSSTYHIYVVVKD